SFLSESNTVVLLHGWNADARAWGKVASADPDKTMRQSLENAAFHTEAPSYNWRKPLPDCGAQFQRWFDSQPMFKSARVVAHSFGGLTTRWFLERSSTSQPQRRIPELITLGTPHHGTVLSSNLIALVKTAV